MNNYGNIYVSHPFVGLLLFILEFEIEGKFSSLIEVARRTYFTAYPSGVSIRKTLKDFLNIMYVCVCVRERERIEPK